VLLTVFGGRLVHDLSPSVSREMQAACALCSLLYAAERVT